MALLRASRRDSRRHQVFLPTNVPASIHGPQAAVVRPSLLSRSAVWRWRGRCRRGWRRRRSWARSSSQANSALLNRRHRSQISPHGNLSGNSRHPYLYSLAHSAVSVRRWAAFLERREDGRDVLAGTDLQGGDISSATRWKRAGQRHPPVRLPAKSGERRILDCQPLPAGNFHLRQVATRQTSLSAVSR